MTNWYEYMPYGEMLMENTTMDYDNPYRFNSKELDMATGYYYYGARYYDPKRSFWLSVDPLSEITQSPYAYVWNDPVNFADPTGLMGERVGGPGHGPKTIKDCFGGGDNYGPDPLPKHMRTAAIRIAAAGVNSVGSGQFKGNSGAEKLMNNLMINYAGSHDMTLGQMASMQNEIGQFYQGLVLVRGWDKETYDGLYTKVIKNLKLNHEGVQYGTAQAIKEAENNWGVLGMAGEVSAMIAAEGLFPVNAGKITPKGASSSAAHYEEILSKRSFVNAYPGGGASIENIPLIQREQIQRAANKWNVEITVIGSRARGSADYGSDWDYIVSEIKPGMLHDMRFRLPKSNLSRGDLGRARLEIWQGTIKTKEAHITFKPFRN